MDEVEKAEEAFQAAMVKLAADGDQWIASSRPAFQLVARFYSLLLEVGLPIEVANQLTVMKSQEMGVVNPMGGFLGGLGQMFRPE